MNKRGLLIVFSGPSGVGKGTVLEKYLQGKKNTVYSVSATTRDPRPNEMHGTHYYFLSDSEFERRIVDGEMLEYAQFAGNYYGTPKKEAEYQLLRGRDLILEIEVQGAMQVKESHPDALLIFVMPPSFAELQRRLHKRGTEDAQTISRRLAEAANEISFAGRYDYILVNDDADAAAKRLEMIIGAAKCSAKYLTEFIDGVKDDAKTFCE